MNLFDYNTQYKKKRKNVVFSVMHMHIFKINISNLQETRNDISLSTNRIPYFLNTETLLFISIKSTHEQKVVTFAVKNFFFFFLLL